MDVSIRYGTTVCYELMTYMTPSYCSTMLFSLACLQITRYLLRSIDDHGYRKILRYSYCTVGYTLDISYLSV